MRANSQNPAVLANPQSQKQNEPAVLNRLVAQKVCFNGKFSYGVQAALAGRAEAQQGTVVEELDASVNYLVLADLSASKGVQKEALKLNAKGATIQVIDADAFAKIVEPTETDVLALIRGGKKNAVIFKKVFGGVIIRQLGHPAPAAFVLTGENLNGLDLEGFEFDKISFIQCSFVGSKLGDVSFGSVTDCDFSNADAASTTFAEAPGCLFVKANLKEASFEGNFSGADFSAATIDGGSFTRFVYRGTGAAQSPMAGAVFAGASLKKAKFSNLLLASPDFDGADLTGASFSGLTLTAASFRNANLDAAGFLACNLPQANFTGANCRLANFPDADLTDARFDGADLTGCNLRGANLQGADLSKAKNYNPAAITGGNVGPALTELDQLATQARRINVSFHVRTDPADEGIEVGVDTSGLKYGWGIQVPPTMAWGRRTSGRTNRTFSDAMIALANLVNRQVRFETLDVKTTKSPKSGKELRELVLRGISEAFAQPIPPAEELAKLTREFQDQHREQKSIDRERREKAKELAEKEKQTAKKQIAKKIAKEVGKVADIASFLKALEVRADKSKIDKATKMLKAEKFQLFNDITETHLNGVVKSQTDPDLVYACRIESGGGYACCTQNLNICGGLRGSICKHLLVLIIGLVKAGELDPSTIDGWIAKTHDTKPELNKETMGEIFIRYKGAEAGEVDWRPTETVPEDYYAV